jgi:hypothetical protein
MNGPERSSDGQHRQMHASGAAHTALCSPDATVIAPALAKKRSGRRENTRHPEAEIVVPVVGFVPVTI